MPTSFSSTHGVTGRSILALAAMLLASGPAAARQATTAGDDRRAMANEIVNRILDPNANPEDVVAVLQQPQAVADETFGAGPVGEAMPRRVGPIPRSLEVVNAFQAAPIVLPALQADDVIDYEARPVRVGRVAEIAANSQNNGQWFNLPNGGRLWALTVSSPDAASLRLRINPLDPPRGAELITYNAADPTESYGPVTRARMREGEPYWTSRVFGNTVRVEYYLPPEVQGAHHLSIDGALLFFHDHLGNPDDGGLAGLTCDIDVTCDAAWASQALATAHIQFVSGGSGFICSGAMVNRNPAFDGTPYFFTASHCISTQAEASSIEVYWLFQAASCGGAVPALNTVPRTDGSELLANAGLPDYTLLGLTMTDIPGGLVWSGWNSASPANPEAGVIIHHPNGVRKSISYGQFEGIDGAEPCAAPIDTTFRFDLSDGGQKGGSSGGPVFSTAGQQIRAVVSCSETPGATCDPDENCWEGSLNAAYPGWIQSFLTPAGTTVYVNGAYGGAERGTLAQPWNESIEGHFGVPGGGTLVFVAGTYAQYSFIGGSKGFLITGSGGTVFFE